jgi:hypothetical protein
MDAIDRAQTNAVSLIGEALTNQQVRQSFTSFFVANAGELYAFERLRPEIKSDLNRILKLKGADPSIIYRGLLIQISGAFEIFIKQLTSAVLAFRRSKVERYNQLDEKLREAHVFHSSVVLSKIQEKQINGIKYDFLGLMKSLGSCFSDIKDFELNSEVFTLLMGNCTPKRLKGLFEIIGLSDPFDDEMGRNSAVQRWAKGIGSRSACKKAEKELEEQIAKRNAIAHGDGTISVSSSDVEGAGEFFLALIDALVEKARKLVPVSEE